MGSSYTRRAARSLAAFVVLGGVFAPSALGYSFSIEIDGIKALRPGNASITLGMVQSPRDIASGVAVGIGTPNLRVKSGRPSDVAVMYGIKRVGKTRNYRIVVFAMRRPGSASSAAASKLTLETVGSDGRRATVSKTGTIQNVIGPNRVPASPQALNQQGFTFNVIGGTLPHIGTKQYIAQNLAAEAFNQNKRPGRAKFVNGIESQDDWETPVT